MKNTNARHLDKIIAKNSVENTKQDKIFMLMS